MEILNLIYKNNYSNIISDYILDKIKEGFYELKENNTEKIIKCIKNIGGLISFLNNLFNGEEAEKFDPYMPSSYFIFTGNENSGLIYNPDCELLRKNFTLIFSFKIEEIINNVIYPLISFVNCEGKKEILFNISIRNHQLQLYSLHGQSKDALKKNQPGQWEYDIVGTWYKCNMTDVVAAIGLIQFERYPNMLKRRQEIISKYDEAFKPLGIESLSHYNDKHTSSGHLYISRVFKKNGNPISDQERREIIVKMAEAGIACNVHYKPLPMHTAYKNLGFDIKDYPNAYNHYANEITLPLHTNLTDEQVDYIIQNYKEILKGYVGM